MDPLQLEGKQLLGRYTIAQRLATGGMSFVYRGQDERLHRPVCVKVFFTLTQDRAEFRTGYEHFVQEAFALSQLQHPNTLRIYDFGYLEHEPHSPFYVCELMTGGTLSGLIREGGPLPAPNALAVLEPIVFALAEAHAHHIIHRDIKPSNILFGEAGSRRIVKLADFGIAKALFDEQARSIPNRASETNVRGQGLSLFSPGWAAPEQIKCRPVGPYTDVFALGLVLAYMLTGRRVFEEGNYAKNLTHRMEGDAFVAAALERLNVPRPMYQVLVRACRVKPSERFPTVEAFLRAARDVATVEPVRGNQDPDTDPAGAAAGDPAAATAPLMLTTLSTSEVLAGGRRVRLIPTSGILELGGDEEAALPSPARIRLTFLPGGGRSHLAHLKGLNCFLAQDGGRPCSGVALGSDAFVELRSPGRQRLDALSCQFGVPGPADVRFFSLGASKLGVPRELTPHAVLLDFGPGREAALVYSISSRRSDS
jgi:serine/threonine-protein kinase